MVQVQHVLFFLELLGAGLLFWYGAYPFQRVRVGLWRFHHLHVCIQLIHQSIVTGPVCMYVSSTNFKYTCLLFPSICIIVNECSCTCNWSWIHSWILYADMRGLFRSNMHTIVRCLSLIVARSHCLSDCTWNTSQHYLMLPYFHFTLHCKQHSTQHNFTARLLNADLSEQYNWMSVLQHNATYYWA
jgi:hypothetical protein